MFDLEQAIVNWRREMLATGITSPVTLAELEIHLREEIEQQTLSNVTIQEAFEAADRKIGQSGVLKSEFTKIGVTMQDTIKHSIPAFVGIPDLQLVTNMNTANLNSNIEPRWATYLKAATFLIPAAFCWLFALIFLMPKLQEICRRSGRIILNFNESPVIFKGLIFLSSNQVLIGGFISIALVFLEWRCRWWSRYRRGTIGFGVFLFNMAVLYSITLMLFDALSAAPYGESR
jgi:hypothetical protein